jgi:hypothetical protein
MFRTIHARLSGGAIRWLAVPAFAVMVSAAGVSVVARPNPVLTAFGASTAANACATLQTACPKHPKVTVKILYPNAVRQIQVPIKVGAIQAISPVTPAEQARIAKFQASTLATIVTH